MLQLIEVVGKDAGEFLHRVTAGTVKDIGVGQGRAGLLLTGQSQVIAQFDVWRPAAHVFRLAAPSECADALAEGLEKLHFSEDLEMKKTDLQAFPVANGAKEKRPDIFPVARDRWPSPVPGFDFVIGAPQGVPEGFHYARIGAGVPWPPLDWSSETKALEAGMLPWIDRNKGCYPGQEVVELSLNVGHPARVLVPVEAAAAPGKTVSWDGVEVPVLSSAMEQGRARFFVRVPWAKKDFSGFSHLLQS